MFSYLAGRTGVHYSESDTGKADRPAKSDYKQATGNVSPSVQTRDKVYDYDDHDHEHR